MTALFHLQDVHVLLQGQSALRGVSLDFHPGERVALIGANGSGKSTLLRTLNGLLPIAQGQMQRQSDVRMAMLFQRPHLLRSSVCFNLTLSLWLDRTRPLSWAQARQQAFQALERVGLADLAQQSGIHLSGGQLQRVALARAWARQPQVLLLDEPTASLDPHAKREVEQLIWDFATSPERAVTLVWASHNLGQVKRMATRVMYLEQGRILADLPVDVFFNPDQLPCYSEAAHLFLKGETA